MSSNICRRCGQPVKPGFNWHSTCLSDYRAEVPYREETLRRDGYACARCPRWWNRLVTDWYGGVRDDVEKHPRSGHGFTPGFRNTHLGWMPEFRVPTPYRTKGKKLWFRTTPVMRRERWVQVDHVDPLASATGTHDPDNMQVLCQGRPFLHHPRKTKRDLARLKGRRVPWTFTRWQLLGLLTILLGLLVWQTGFSWPLTAAATSAVGALVLLHRLTNKVRRRLHAVYSKKTGASRETWRMLRCRRWRLARVEDLWLPRLRPRWQRIDYPDTFDDHDPEVRADLEDTVVAKNGAAKDGWVFAWNTEADRLITFSPDPLQKAGAVRWPLVDTESLDVWDGMLVGFEGRGDPLRTNIIGKNFLTGGEPESGKSAAQSIREATFALDVTTDMILFDLKGGVEQAVWEGCSSLPVITTMAEALDAALYIHDLIDLRAGLLREHQNETGEIKRKFSKGDGMGPVGVFVDELAELTSGGEKKDRDKLIELFRSNISRGRAFGVFHDLSTQRPSAQVVPTDIRDIINYRMALRSTTADSSDMILGRGWASQGFNAARIDSEARGVAYLYAEGGKPRRMRGYYLDDGDVLAIARRAERLRKGVGLAGQRASDASPAVDVRPPAQP